MFFDLVEILLLTSALANGFLVYRLAKKKKEPQPTKDAQALLAEILSGQAVVKIEVLDAHGLFYRSPRK